MSIKTWRDPSIPARMIPENGFPLFVPRCAVTGSPELQLQFNGEPYPASLHDQPLKRRDMGWQSVSLTTDQPGALSPSILRHQGTLAGGASTVLLPY